MNFITFIKAYRIALYKISENVKQWKAIYLADVTLPDSDNSLNFVFSDTYSIGVGSKGFSIALKAENIKNIEDANIELDSLFGTEDNPLSADVVARSYIARKEKINEAGRIGVILEKVLTLWKILCPDTWKDTQIKYIYFNDEDDLLEIELDSEKVYTDGNLIMFDG